MATITIDRTAVPSVLHAGMRPAWNQIAAVTSMLLPLVSRVNRNWLTLVASPAASSNPMWRSGLACQAARSSAEGSAAFQARS